MGLGASAGGLNALIRFFETMPADTGMIFVVVQHLDPTHESLTAELIGRHTAMGVVEVQDEMRVEPNRVYVIPPNRYLTISGGTLHLTAPPERRGLRVPIDFFLRSLAQDQQERGIGIIFSGTGTDGTLGVRKIKAAGGIVLVQSPETCQFDGMPRSAIEHQIAELAEGERQRIGAELHDTLGQEITAIGMIVSALREQLGENWSQAGTLEKLEILVNQSKTQLRSVAKGLLPVAVDASGLRIALGKLAKEIKELCRIDCRLECPKSIGLADSFVATQLYLIAREAAHNAGRHSKAHRIVIRLEDSKGLRLSIQDDGVGMAGRRQAAEGMGVEIMRHRSGLIGATLRIESPPEGGVLVNCSVWNPR